MDSTEASRYKSYWEQDYNSSTRQRMYTTQGPEVVLIKKSMGKQVNCTT